MRGWSRRLRFFAMVAPAVLGFALFNLGPMLEAGWLSLTRYDVVAPPEFVGLANYVYLLARDRAFWPSVQVTLCYAAVSVPAGLLLALGWALVLAPVRRGGAWLRTIFFLPTLLPAAAASAVWVCIFHPSTGLLNRLLAVVGIAGPAWTQSVDWALPALILMGLWTFGGAMLVLLAGLATLPPELHEAAAIDGAGVWGRCWHVTLPHLAPLLFFNAVMATIGALKVFDTAFVFGVAAGHGVGGPARATLFYGLNLYLKAFSYFHFGLASAMAWLLFAALALLTWLGFRLAGRWLPYGGSDDAG